jgi:UDP-3-O-[3-hydroxymyristoyl] glucosamine N-acyltransferase
MTEPIFVKAPSSLRLAEIAELTGAEIADPAGADFRIGGVAALDLAGPHDLTFFENVRYEQSLVTSRAGACLVNARLESRVPAGIRVLRAREPYKAFVAVIRALHPDMLRPRSTFESSGVAAGSIVHPTARLEDGVVVDPGAMIGPRAEIGSGSVVSAGAVIGADVRVGRDCVIGAGASITFTLIGDRVIIHPGCRIGQDGFGFMLGASGHSKVPQIGRVIIQNDVEIGAGTTIDRGAIRDTVVGEGSKIDNLVQIGHNVAIGRNCVIVAQSGISGSATLEDNVVLGARAGVNNHVTVGRGSQIAAVSVVHGDVPPGSQWGGTPARPIKQWFREALTLERLARRESEKPNEGKD